MKKSMLIAAACMALVQNAHGVVAAEVADALKLYGWAQEHRPPGSALDAHSKRTRAALLDNIVGETRDANHHVGVVVSSIEAPGVNTTYIELEMGGKSVWIASRITKVEPGDKVRFSPSGAITMEHFESRVLKRSFEKIYFVPSITVTSLDAQ